MACLVNGECASLGAYTAEAPGAATDNHHCFGSTAGVSFLLRFVDKEAFTVDSSLGPARVKPSDGMQNYAKHFVPVDSAGRFPYLCVPPQCTPTPAGRLSPDAAPVVV